MADTKKSSAVVKSPTGNLDYFDILKNAFNMVRHHRYLWYLGILAGGSFGSGFNSSWNFGDFFQQKENSSQASSVNSSFNEAGIWTDIVKWLQENWVLVVVLAAILLFLIIIFTALSIMAKAGLVHSVDNLSENKESSFMDAMRFGWHKFWSVFGASILFGLITLGIVILLVAPAVLAWFINPFLGIFCALFVLLALLFFLIIIGVVYEYTLRYITLKEGKAVESIKSGYGLLKNKKKETVLIWLITVGVAIVSGIVLIMDILLVGLILFLLGLLFFILNHVAGIVYVVIAVTAFIIALFIASGFISSFVSAYWTLCFKELTA